MGRTLIYGTGVRSSSGVSEIKGVCGTVMVLRGLNKCQFFVFLILIFVLLHQCFNIYLKNVRIQEQSQLISHLNSTWAKFKEEHDKLSSNRRSDLSNLQSSHAESPKHQGQRIPNHDTISYQRDLKPLPIFFTKRAVLFTMDSIGSYEADSKKGGASGELLIRHCLETAFKDLGIYLETIRSDEQFASINMEKFDIIIVDPWTWAGKGWKPKQMLIGNEKKIFVLDFFGSESLLNAKTNFIIPPTRLLTAFGSPWNTFLGYYLNETTLMKYRSQKLSQGVIWGKDPKHYSSREKLLQTLSNEVELHSTATRKVIAHSKITWHGHQTPESWMKLLGQSKFLLGLGDPLLGPSAVDAIAMGSVYINPIYTTPIRQIHKSQHDYAANVLGKPYVCNAHLDRFEEVMGCVKYALQNELQPFIPSDFKYEEYLKRVRRIFLEEI